MGDPKKSRRKYDTPSHPWEGERIANEKEYVKQYGLKNKKEFWKAQSSIRKYRSQAKDLMARTRAADKQAQMEVDLLKKKMIKLGLLTVEGTLDDILALSVEAVLNRRLQTIVYHKGLASSCNQARQLVSHGHIMIDGTVVTIPGRILTKKEEESVLYNEFSPLSNELHPARPKEKTMVEAEVEEAKQEQTKAAHELKLTPKAKKVLEQTKVGKEDVEAIDEDLPAPEEEDVEETEEGKENKKAETKEGEK